MGLIVEGHGFSIAHGEVSLTQKPISVGIPGYSKAELDRTTQGNTSVKTARAATLRKYDTFMHVMPYDPVDYAALEASSGSVAHTITFPDSAGVLTIYAELLQLGAVTQETDGRPTYDATFLVTNLNGTTETAPAFVAGS